MFRLIKKIIKLAIKLVFALVVIALLGYGINFAFQEFFVKTEQRNCARLLNEIKKYDWDHDTAFAIARAESKCNPGARGDEKLIFKGCYRDLETNLDAKEPFKNHEEYACKDSEKRDFGYSVGAFQIRILPGRLKCDTYDLATNVKCAYKVYQEKNNSFTPWSVYLDGKYQEFLPKKHNQ